VEKKAEKAEKEEERGLKFSSKFYFSMFLSLNTNDQLQYFPVFLFFLDFSDALQYRIKICLILLNNLIGLTLNDHSSC